MELESTDLNQYLKATGIIDWDNADVRTKAESIAGGLDNGVEKARSLFAWVRDQIPHSADIDSDLNPCTASETLSAGTGMCYAKSHLLAALLRAINIPSGFCYQVLRRTLPFEGFVLHALNGIYLRPLDTWIRLDARGNTGQICAQFGMGDEGLAFRADDEVGESMYETIYCDPAPAAVAVLNRFTGRREMWPNLPSELHGTST